MNRFLLVRALLLASSLARVVVAAPEAKAAAATATPMPLPREVRAAMTPGAHSLRLIQAPLGLKGAPMLIHLWTLARNSGSPGAQGASLSCIDIFRGGSRAGQWRRAGSQPFVSHGWYTSEPSVVLARSLRPARKEGWSYC